jgi:hypothetical protein
LPPHDFHAAGRLFYYIHAVVEGVPELPGDSSENGNSPPSPPLRSRSRPSSPARDTSPYGFSPSPIPGVAELSISGGLDQTGSVLQLPSYEEQAEAALTEDKGWLRGTFRSKRRLQLGYLPSSTGGVTPFEDRLSQDVPGLGTVDIRVQVDEVSSDGDRDGGDEHIADSCPRAVLRGSILPSSNVCLGPVPQSDDIRSTSPPLPDPHGDLANHVAEHHDDAEPGRAPAWRGAVA